MNLKPKQQEQQLKIKKPLVKNGYGMNEYMNITQANKEIEKYKNVLENCTQQNGSTWIAKCPNKEMHSNNERKRSFTVAVVKTQEENVKRFGEYMITFCCYAGKTDHCSNKILADKFKELDPTIKLGQTKQKKKIEPHYFPLNDKSYLEINRVRERSEDEVYEYKNIHGHVKFVYWKNFNKTTKSNDYHCISYSKLAGQGIHPRYNEQGEIDGGWVEENLWEDNRPFYRLDELTKYTGKTFHVFEGEGVANKAQKLKWFEDSFCTAYSGGATTWAKTNWDGLEKFEIISIGDNDLAGKEGSEGITKYFKHTKGYNAQMVVVPSWLPHKWDFKDPIPEELNVEEMLANTVVPSLKTTDDYTTLDYDVVRKRWTHLKDSRKYYFDHFTKVAEHKENVNDWYEADSKVKRGGKSPVKYMHSKNINIAQGLAYIPSDEEDIWRDGQRYINSYKPAKHIELTQDEINNIDNAVFFHQADILTNFDAKLRTYLFDIVATLIQKPKTNIKFAVLFISESEGTGKDYFLTTVAKMVGGLNAKQLDTDQITKPLGRSWMKDKHVLVCSEYEVVGTRAEIKRQINTTKTLITNEVHSCEPKGVDPFNIYNHFTLFLASNENAHVMINDVKSRRWAVFECYDERDSINAKYPTHFADMEKFVNDEKRIAGLQYYFNKQYKISEGFKSYEALVTTSKVNIVNNLKSQLFRNIDEVLLVRRLPMLKTKDVFDVRKLYEELSREVGFADISETDIRDYAKKSQDCFDIAKGEAVTLIEGDSKSGRGTRNYIGFANKEFWVDDMLKHGYTKLRLHMAGKFHVPEFGKKKQEELYDTEVSYDEMANQRNENDEEQAI